MISNKLFPTAHINGLSATALVDMPGVPMGDVLTLRLERLRLNDGVQVYSIGARPYFQTFRQEADLLAVWKFNRGKEKIKCLFQHESTS